MNVYDFRRIFSYFTITYYHDDWELSFYEQNSLDYADLTYTFEVPRTQEVFVSANIYLKRSYPCSGATQNYDMSLWSNGVMMDSVRVTHSKGTAHFRQINLPVGKYEVKVGMTSSRLT